MPGYIRPLSGVYETVWSGWNKVSQSNLVKTQKRRLQSNHRITIWWCVIMVVNQLRGDERASDVLYLMP